VENFFDDEVAGISSKWIFLLFWTLQTAKILLNL